MKYPINHMPFRDVWSSCLMISCDSKMTRRSLGLGPLFQIGLYFENMSQSETDWTLGFTNTSTIYTQGKKRNAPPFMSIFLKCMKTIVTKIIMPCVNSVQCWVTEKCYIVWFRFSEPQKCVNVCVLTIVNHGGKWVKLRDELDHSSTVYTQFQ